MPTLENVMYNNMSCSMMMFGSRVRFGIAYKSNQPGFTIYSRKHFHNFKVAISNENYEGSHGSNLAKYNQYIIADKTKIGVYDCDTYELLQSWGVPTNSEDIEILTMTVSNDNQKIGVSLGRNIIKDHYKLTEIAIYIRSSNGEFELEKLRDFDFEDACPTFHFNVKNTNELFFFTREEVFKLDYKDEGKDRETIYTLENVLGDQPNFGTFSPDQRKFIVTSAHDILYVNMDETNPDKREIDYDDKESIG